MPSSKGTQTDGVAGIVAQIMGVPPDRVTEASSPDTIEKWDSLQHMKLILAVEEAFGVQFSDQEIVSIKDVRSINALLTRKLRT